jgi:arylsulfatase A-like enzyme
MKVQKTFLLRLYHHLSPGLLAQGSLPVLVSTLATVGITNSATAVNLVPQRNVIIYVADGLRPSSINPTDAPTLYSLRQNGVNFVNSHSLFPTFTTPNASAIATGHYLGDTGDFSNTIYTGYPVFGGTPTPFIENDAILQDIDEHFGGNYLNEETLLAYARSQGYSTAAVGKLGPTLIQDVTQGNAGVVPTTVIVDDSTGKTGGVPLRTDIASRITNDPYFTNTYVTPGYTTSPTIAPTRSNGVPSTSANQAGNNGFSGNNTTPGTQAPNTIQQNYFTDVLTRAILPTFQSQGQPFAIVFWSRDPDGTQHNQGDSLNSLTPGINGPTSRAAVKNADNDLQQILNTLQSLGIADNTDIFVTSDHGFSTISKHFIDNQGNTVNDYASSLSYSGVNPGYLPSGFVAIDIAHALNLPLYDADTQITDSNGINHYAAVDPTQGQRPRNGDGLIGGSGIVQNSPDARVVVAANGGSDLIYVPDQDRNTVQQLVNFLSQQDYTSGIFVNDAFGSIPGTLPISSINLSGSTDLPVPSIVLNFKTFDTGCGNPAACEVEIADTGLQQGQGMHGSFGRGDTFNNMLAFGPDFKTGFVDQAPVSNADVATTLASILGFNIPSNGDLRGRVISEALVGGPDSVAFTSGTLASDPAANGVQTFLNYQDVNGTRYFDAAGFADRSVGLSTSEKVPEPSTILGSAVTIAFGFLFKRRRKLT